MNGRERNILIAVIVVLVGGGLLYYAANRWFLSPLAQYEAEIKTMRDENQVLEDQLDLFAKDHKKLLLARLKSLPANPSDAAAEYMSYLKPLMESSGLVVVDLTNSAQDMRGQASGGPNAKKPGHQVLTFTAHAKGELGAVVKVMERMRKTPYEHRIKNLTLNRQDTGTAKSANGKLDILMVVETLLVAKTENKPGMLPGYDPKLYLIESLADRTGTAPIGWSLLGTTVTHILANRTYEDRDYAEIASKNIFTGAIPVPPQTKIVKVEQPPTPEKEPAVNVPAFVYLIHTIPGEQEAYLHNRIYKSRDTKLIARKQSGYEYFRIIDEDTDVPFFRAKVLRVEGREVYFQVMNHVYKIRTGQSLADAMEKNELTMPRIDLIDEGLYDSEFAADEMKDKKVASKKKTGKGGR